MVFIYLEILQTNGPELRNRTFKFSGRLGRGNRDFLQGD